MPAIGSGTISAGQSEVYSAVLQAGSTYRIYAEPTDPTVDIDLYVYDENNNLVAKDDDLSSNALCQVMPRWTGRFSIQVKCARGYSSYNVIVG